MPSTVSRHHRYDETSRALVITFVSGKVYRYLDVPEGLYEDMKAAFSKGSFFNRKVRDHFAFVEETPKRRDRREGSDGEARLI